LETSTFHCHATANTAELTVDHISYWVA